VPAVLLVVTAEAAAEAGLFHEREVIAFAATKSASKTPSAQDPNSSASPARIAPTPLIIGFRT
jgi:hypothetical protein